MFKTMTLLKRRPGMSLEEFRRYYEENHAPLGLSLMPQARRYMRRYVVPVAYPTTGKSGEPDFDVVTEVWCENRESYEALLAHISRPEIMSLIIEDERKLFDRSKTRLLAVEECESRIGGHHPDY